MNASKTLEVALNDYINKVLIAAQTGGDPDSELTRRAAMLQSDVPRVPVAGQALCPEQRTAALMVAGILIAAKVSIMQAGVLITEMELEDLV